MASFDELNAIGPYANKAIEDLYSKTKLDFTILAYNNRCRNPKLLRNIREMFSYNEFCVCPGFPDSLNSAPDMFILC